MHNRTPDNTLITDSLADRLVRTETMHTSSDTHSPTDDTPHGRRQDSSDCQVDIIICKG